MSRTSKKNPGKTEASRHRWLLVRTVSALWRSFCEQQRSLTADARHRFWLRMGIGLLIASAVTAGVTFTGKWAAPRGLDAWDEATLHWLVEEMPLFTFYNATIFESPGNAAMTVPILLVTMIIAVQRGLSLVALGFFWGYVVERPLIYLGWWIWNRSRPDLVAGGAASPPFHSYPSGHATISIFVYGFLVWLWCRASESVPERAFALLSGALLVSAIGWARLRLGTHWPSDVLAGFLIGGVWLACVIWSIGAGTIWNEENDWTWERRSIFSAPWRSRDWKPNFFGKES